MQNSACKNVDSWNYPDKRLRDVANHSQLGCSEAM